ncbi:MAG TPA: hypothetical protein DCZ04_10940 [Syntrophorhabdus aromaticivorans]|nr:hypothetical protein [Syntrophorhabdus aromaticivorans]
MYGESGPRGSPVHNPPSGRRYDVRITHNRPGSLLVVPFFGELVRKPVSPGGAEVRGKRGGGFG